ncbi:hypothetical protein BGZ83_003530 [Gryganskiella cystojenkinii]|nr:hypothetical protein BGZ83_003530 [Gryganskiella cystojenkinii]
MQLFKSIITLSAVAVALVSAQDGTVPYESNPCSQCTLSSFPKEATCASLSAANQALLQSIFANNTVSIPNLIMAAQTPPVKNCLCHWSTGTLNATGAAASCSTGAAPVCNATQVEIATAQMAPLSGVIHCDAIVSNSTGATPPAGATPTGTASPNSGSEFVVSNLVGAVVVVATAAMGLGGMVGF